MNLLAFIIFGWESLLVRVLALFGTLKEYQAFIDWEQCECGRTPTAGEVRLFEKNFTKMAPDAMPDAAWAWGCNIKLKGETILVKMALTAPPLNSRPAMESLGRSLGCKQLTWQRLKFGKLFQKTFPL